MANKNNLIVFLSILAGLVIISWVVAVISRPLSTNTNPLRNIDRRDWTKIVIKNPQGQAEFENKNQKWLMIKPVVDDVSYYTMDRILTSLTSFYAGSVISENPKNFEKFGVAGSSAILVQVFVKNALTPVLDINIGQKPGDYFISYIKPGKKNAVSLAYELPLYLFNYPLDEYREKMLIPVRSGEAKNYKLAMDKNELTLYQASNTWVSSLNGRPVADNVIGDLNTVIISLRAQRFATEVESKGLGEAKTLMKLTVEGPRGTVIGIITDRTLAGPALASKVYLCRNENRQGVLLIADTDVKALKDFLTKIIHPAK